MTPLSCSPTDGLSLTDPEDESVPTQNEEPIVTATAREVADASPAESVQQCQQPGSLEEESMVGPWPGMEVFTTVDYVETDAQMNALLPEVQGVLNTGDQSLPNEPTDSDREVFYFDPSLDTGPSSIVDHTNAETTTQHESPMLPDFEIDDETWAQESTSTSYVSSIASEISRGILENERLYPQYGKHSYGMPIDEAEMDRMDLQHRKYELVIGDRHFLAPIGDCPQRILDLATGTGIWALDVADMFPSAEVLGVDIAPIQPKWVAPNCSFEIDDIEDTWTYRTDNFDFIHLRDPLYMVRDWPKLMRQMYEHTKPGGWVELASVYPRVMCDDGSMPDDSMFKFICDKFIEASYGMGAPLDSCLRFAEYLRTAGFVDVAEHVFKMPSSPWPKNERLKKIGALEMTNVVEGASAFGLRVFSHAYGWTREETELAMVGFRRDVKNRKYHQYVR